MFLHPCFKPYGCLTNVGLLTAAGDLVNDFLLLLCWQCVLDLGQDGPEGSPRFEDHPQTKLLADSPDMKVIRHAGVDSRMIILDSD